jgi:hypothetical protein
LNLSLEQAALQRHAYLADATKIRVTMPSYRNSLPPHLREDAFAFGNAIKFARRRASVTEGSRKTIIVVGGLKPNKNVWPVLEAFRNLSAHFPEWEMVICGEGKLRDDVTRFVADAALQDRILLLGDVDDMYSVYEKSHLHVIGSLEEGNPLAVCESMVHGLPSIGYADCAGTNEHIRHGKNGLLAGTVNRVQGLQNCMKTLMSNARMRKQFGDQAFEDSAVFDGNAIYDTWEKMFREAYAYREDRNRKFEERAVLQPQLEHLYGLIREEPSRIKNEDFLSELRATYKTSDARILSTIDDEQSRENQIELRQARRGRRFRTWLFAMRHLSVIRSSNLFDSEYYKKHNSDALPEGSDPVKHYYFYGGYEGRNPSANFDSAAYLEKYPDVRAEQINPLVHFVLFGQHEGRTPR